LNIQRIVHLTPPLIAPDNIKEKIVCIRAHRERMFQISVESQQNKLIFHNYGQGGAGWTFLFGCVNESIKQFEEQCTLNSALKNESICILGAGCYGLLTAILLKRKGFNVHIIAAETENIPSNKAAGFFFPRPRKCSTPDEAATFLSLGIHSYATYLDIMNGKHPFIKAGPKLLPAYFGLDIDPGFGPYVEQELMNTSEKVTIDFGNGKTYEAMEYNTVFINSAAIMQELHRNIGELGIVITKAEIQEFGDVPEPIIFNCTSLGAKKLTQDKRLIPVQGHLITLKNQPPMDQLQYMINVKVVMTNALGKQRDELIYYAPREDGILGITFIRGQDSATANQHEFDRLLERCHNYFGT